MVALLLGAKLGDAAEQVAPFRGYVKSRHRVIISRLIPELDVLHIPTGSVTMCSVCNGTSVVSTRQGLCPRGSHMPMGSHVPITMETIMETPHGRRYIYSVRSLLLRISFLSSVVFTTAASQQSRPHIAYDGRQAHYGRQTQGSLAGRGQWREARHAPCGGFEGTRAHDKCL